MKIALACLAMLGLTLAPLSAQCGGCESKTSKASQGCTSKASQDCGSKTSKASQGCTSKASQDCGSKTSKASQDCDSKAKTSTASQDCKDCDSATAKTGPAATGVAAQLAKLSPEKRQAVIDAMATLKRTCPTGRRMGPSMTTLDGLYKVAIQSLQTASKSGNLNAKMQVSVDKSLALISKASKINTSTVQSIALVSGTAVGKGSCGKSAGGCEKASKAGGCEGGSCDKTSKAAGGCDKSSKAGGCEGGSCDKTAKAGGDCDSCDKTSVAAPSFTDLCGYTKKLCGSWSKVQKESKSMTEADKAALMGAMEVVKPLGIFDNLSKKMSTQVALVRAAVKMMPSADNCDCPIDGKNCAVSSKAIANVYALLSSMPMGTSKTSKASGDCESCTGEAKTGCSETSKTSGSCEKSKGGCSETSKTSPAPKKGCCDSKIKQ